MIGANQKKKASAFAFAGFALTFSMRGETLSLYVTPSL